MASWVPAAWSLPARLPMDWNAELLPLVRPWDRKE